MPALLRQFLNALLSEYRIVSYVATFHEVSSRNGPLLVHSACTGWDNQEGWYPKTVKSNCLASTWSCALYRLRRISRYYRNETRIRDLWY